MPLYPLNQSGWELLTHEYSDNLVITTLLGICQFGCRISYEGSHRKPKIYVNPSTAQDEAHVVSSEIQIKLGKHRLKKFSSIVALPQHYTASPLGLIDKSDGTKRQIHPLSYPPADQSAINDRIPEEYRTITYSSINEATSAIQDLGANIVLIKPGSESAFRHIPISALNLPLLGFHWEGAYYAEQFLPFGLQRAPYIINLVAEVCHWLLNHELQMMRLTVRLINYLDDLLLVLPLGWELHRYSDVFSELFARVGLLIKVTKNEEGSIPSFAGIEIDTDTMVIPLSTKKLQKAQDLVQNAIARRSAMLLELRKITGYVNFVSSVVPLGRTFVPLLHTIEL